MKVIVTGAAGNIGANVVRSLVAEGHQVRGFDQPNAVSLRRARRLPRKVEMLWGDIRAQSDVTQALADQEIVVHLAFILPPAVEEQPQLAEAVNVGGTQNVINAAKEALTPPKVVFASSLDVFGPTLDQPPPRRVTDPVFISDEYTRHKLLGEQLLRKSGLKWAIMRFADVPPMASREPHPIMFRIPWQTRIEALHPADAGLAIARAVGDDRTWNQLWLIGGGTTCQVTYAEYLGKMLDAIGVGRLPESAFGSDPYYTDWLDSSASEARWHYQRHSFDDIVRDAARAVGPSRHLVPLIRPLVRQRILRLSPYFKPGSTRV